MLAINPPQMALGASGRHKDTQSLVWWKAPLRASPAAALCWLETCSGRRPGPRTAPGGRGQPLPAEINPTSLQFESG